MARFFRIQTKKINGAFYKVIDLCFMQFKFKSEPLEYKIESMIRFHDAVVAQHSKVFPKYHGLARGKDVVIVATGKTLQSYQPIEGAIHIGVNKAILDDRLKLDYYFVQDYAGDTKKYLHQANAYRPNECTKFYGRLHGVNAKSVIPYSEIEAANANMYYTTNPNNAFCLDLSCNELADFRSIVFSALSFAFWMHPKRIYLVGCDCSNIYFDNSKRRKSFSVLLDAWLEAKAFRDINYPDIEIVSINPVGLKGIFEDIYQDK